MIHVRARERKVLEHEHPRLIRLFVELQRQHVGDDPDRVEVRLLGRGKIGGKDLRRQLVEPVRGRVAGTAQKHRAPVDAKAPAARTDRVRIDAAAVVERDLDDDTLARRVFERFNGMIPEALIELPKIEGKPLTN